jgi:hypothetical protein
MALAEVHSILASTKILNTFEVTSLLDRILISFIISISARIFCSEPSSPAPGEPLLCSSMPLLSA